MIKTLKERLMAKIRINNESGCWEWTAGKRNGYGHLWSRDDGGPVYAHRASYELHCGMIPEEMRVCHHCDNAGCINPSHLFLGTQADNMADMAAKGRQTRGDKHITKMKRVAARGSSNGSAKLCESDVIAIRSARGISTRRLADQFGVSPGMISLIRSGKNWTHVSK